MNCTDLFNFNLFNDENERKQLPYPYTDYCVGVVCFLYGLIGFDALFRYLFKGILPFKDGSYLALLLLSGGFILFSIYAPIRLYINQKFYIRLIVSLSYQQENGLDIILYNQQHLKIINYEIIYDWKEYALTFFLFIHKVEEYQTSWIFANENALYYTIKDLDTGILYLYCVNKEQYLNALEQEGKKRILTKTLK